MSYNINNLNEIPLELLESILDVVNFILLGKGNIRHGNNKPLLEQDWAIISEKTGDQFLTGQALKKIMEIRNIDFLEDKVSEIQGAISYLLFWLIWNKLKMYQKSSKDNSNLESIISGLNVIEQTTEDDIDEQLSSHLE